MPRQDQRGNRENSGREKEKQPAERMPARGEEKGDQGAPRREPREDREVRLPGNEQERGTRMGNESGGKGPQDKNSSHGADRQGREESSPQRQGERKDGPVDVERELEKVGAGRER